MPFWNPSFRGRVIGFLTLIRAEGVMVDCPLSDDICEIDPFEIDRLDAKMGRGYNLCFSKYA